MKKNVLILIIMMLLFAGCNKNEISKVNNDDKVKVQDNVVDDKVKSVTENEEEIDDSKTNEIVVKQAEELTTTRTAIKKVTTKNN